MDYEPLTAEDYAELERSWIPPAIADCCQIRRVSHEEGKTLTSWRKGNLAGIVFPYVLPGQVSSRSCRLRRDQPEVERRPDGSTKAKNKYLGPPGYPSQLYFVPGCPSSWLANKRIPVFIVEGEKKAIAMARYFNERDEKTLVIGLAGVWNWRVKETFYDEQAGAVVELSKPIADLDLVCWIQRNVSILFDADLATNQQVMMARTALQRELTERGSHVRLYDLPPDGPKGVDDFLYERGPEALTAILSHEHGTSWQAHELTDVGMVERVADYAPGDFLYVDEWEQWGYWNGSYWDFREGAAALQLATIKTSRLAMREAESFPDPEAFERWARKYRSAHGLAAVRKVAMFDARFRARAESFNSHHWLLPVPNGTLDLRTGKLAPSERDDRMTMVLSVVWDAQAQCPRWERFIEETMCGDQTLINYMQKAIGYSLTGLATEQCFFVCHGDGQNGKGVLFRILRELFGPYFRAGRIESFSRRDKSPGGHDEDLAALEGGRIVLMSEAEEGMALSEALIKMLTGEDAPRVSHKYGRSFALNPTFKIWIAANHLPIIRSQDKSIWRRPVKIPFNNQVPAERRDGDLTLKLMEELPGILRWAVEGCLKWQEEGLRKPDAIERAIAEYRQEANWLASFLSERCVQDFTPGRLNEVTQVAAGDLYREYLDWCQQEAERPLGQTMFGRRLTELGHTLRPNFGRKVRLYLRLKAQWERINEEENDGAQTHSEEAQ